MKIEIPKSYDVIGSIAILKFNGEKRKEKKKIANKLIKERKNIESVYEKTGKIKGRLRLPELKWLAGVKTTETVHTESGCKLKLDVEKCYFSPRMSNDRLEIAREIKKKDKVLVMFSGIGPYPIVIGKLANPKKVVGIEINRLASKYAKENVQLNKLDNIEVIQGNVKNITKLVGKEKFDKIIMARPNLKETFLEYSFKVLKKFGIIYYHGFGELDKVLESIYKDSKKLKKKIEILKMRKIGEIAPFKYRFRIEIKVN